MPGATEALVFIDCQKHMECLGGMRLQSFLTLFTRATPGTPTRRYINPIKLSHCKTHFNYKQGG